MAFSSHIFLLYFLPAFLLLYQLIPSRFRNTMAFLGSLFFYTWGAPKFVFVLLAAIAFDYFVVHQMVAVQGKARKRWLAFGIVVNVVLLLYFKYANFFVDNVNSAIEAFGGVGFDFYKVALPIGISFFTFQKLSYIIDVYRGPYQPLKNPMDHGLYVILFPQLIAGPIVRYKDIADQLRERRATENIDYRVSGMYRFILGLARKILIADQLGEVAQAIFETPVDNLGFGAAWLGALAYTFQIYFDFAGYSDMAIGFGKMMGFRFPENFNFPYISKSITEFWRRWHITLGKWMKDYLYLPLGGNRKGRYRTYLNLWLVFLISGWWHGASWNFVIWGAWHGLFLVIERRFLLRPLEKLPRLIAVLYTFPIAVVGWVFFKAKDLETATGFLGKMCSPGTEGGLLDVSPKFVTILIIAMVIAFFGKWLFKPFVEQEGLGRKIFSTVKVPAAFVLLVLSLAYMNAGGFSPFIYFRF